MPDLEPVTGDPFSIQMQPVGGDPFASMTHWPDQPAQPYMHPNVPAAASAIAGFATGGLQGAGTPLPDWAASNPVQRALQNPDNAAAAGMARPFGALSARGQLGKFELSDLHKDFQAGLNNQQIADKYNVTKEAIQQRRNQFGYPQKPRGRPWPSTLEPVSHDPFADEVQPSPYEAVQSALGKSNEEQLLKQRQRQIRYDRRLSGDDSPSGELNAIGDRLKQLKP